MQISKKIYTTLIIAILTISTVLVTIPMASAAVNNVALDETEGLVGTKVTVTGEGAVSFAEVNIYWDIISGTKLLNSGYADVNGEFSVEVTIPEDVAGVHYIIARDDAGTSDYAAFTIEPKIELSTNEGLPDDSLIVTGTGFAPNSDLTIELSNVITEDITPTGAKTNALGSFSISITIPEIDAEDFGDFTVTVTDEDMNTDSADITVDYYVTVSPSFGPPGITVNISGRIEANVEVTVLFGRYAPSELWVTAFTTTTDATGYFSGTYTIPEEGVVVGEAEYIIRAAWDDMVRDTTFNVGPAPTITLDPEEGQVDEEIEITGTGFSANAETNIYFDGTVINTTTTNAAGEFVSTFIVPNVPEGTYTVTATDEYDATANTDFEVILVFITVRTRSTQYMQGDYMSVFSQSTSPQDVYIQIKDPTGLLFLETTAWEGAWMEVGDYFSIPYDWLDTIILPLPDDAPTGTWNFTCYDMDTDEILDTNLFTVAEKPTVQSVLDKLDEMEANITDVITTAKGDIVAVINTKTGQITTSLSAINAKIQGFTTDLDSMGNKLQGLEDMGIIIATDVGEIKVALEDLDMSALEADITSIKNNVATIKTNIGTIQTAVSNLDAKVTDIQGDTATIETNVGTIEGKVTSIEGTVATIETCAGEIALDVTDIKGKIDTTPAWIAAVLAAIAAIAAIFAAITIRQKIAG